MSQVHFEEDAPTSAFIGIDVTDDDMYTSSQAEEDRKGNGDIEMMTSTGTENKAGSFSAFSNILSQRSFKDSTAKEIFCAR